jgi:iron(III) transport system ATP-binding protein
VQATHSGSQSSDVCISIRNVSKSYVTSAGTHLALNNVSLDVMSGGFLVLLGPSGCGKTTLLRAIAGLEELNAGTITQADTLWSAPDQNIWMTPEERQLGMVFQSYALWPHMNVFENIAYPLRNIGTSKADIASKVQKALERMGLAHQASVYPGQLSGGQQQRVALARALVSENQIILFDEPLSNLDAKVRARLRIELADLQKSLGFASIYVTHDQSEALALADRIAVMNSGKIVELGQTKQIFAHPQHPYTQTLLAAAPLLAKA